MLAVIAACKRVGMQERATALCSLAKISTGDIREAADAVNTEADRRDEATA